MRVTIRPLTSPHSAPTTMPTSDGDLRRPAPPAGDDAGPDAGEGQRRADREVEGAADHQQHHAADQDADRREVQQHRPHVRRGREVVRVDDASSPRRAPRPGRTASARASRRARARAAAAARRAASRGARRSSADVRPRSCSHGFSSTSATDAVNRVARRSTCSSVAPSPGQLADGPALGHDDDAVGERQHLGQVGRDDEQRHAACRPARAAAGRSRSARRHRRRASARRR